MAADLWENYSAATRRALANGFGCSESAFDSEELTIVDRPADVTRYTLMGVTFGTGTVLNLDPAFREFAEANRPEKHFLALRMAFIQTLVAEGARRGQTLSGSSPSLCFTIAEQPPAVPVPDGFELRRHDAGWMNTERAERRFENGVGPPGADSREFRNRFALALYDAEGEPAAVAGAFETHGMLEIGVDVARQHRGKALGRLVVSTLAREIMDEGKVPFYGCAATNIRSHRTAESCGFRIVCSDAFVSAPV